MDSGCIHFYYGTGKGKTTAAMGLALRAIGRGIPVTVVQFLKDGSSAECAVLKRIGATVIAGKASPFFYNKMSDSEKLDTERLHNSHLCTVLDAIGGNGLFVLDEVGDAFVLDALDKDLLLKLLQSHGKSEVVMTGHSPVPDLLDLADYQTEMTSHKHPFEQGVPARPGIEF